MTDSLFDQAAEFYDYEYAHFGSDIQFYLEYAQQADGDVLELACGTGRVLIPVAEAGVSITGLDISQRMLHVCQGKVEHCAPNVQKKVTLVQGDMKGFNLHKKFSLIYVPFNSFQCLLTKEDQGACLQSIWSHLDENGLFILSIFAPKHEYLAQPKRRYYMGSFFDTEHNVKVYRYSVTTCNYVKQVLHNDFSYEWTDTHGNFQRKFWSFDMSYLFRYEAELLLEKHGYHVRELYGNYEKDPFDSHSGYQIFISRLRD
jgi:SAM-dependent methyltransferase